MRWTKLDNSDVRTLSREIIISAVKDWDALGRGAKKYAVVAGVTVDREELVDFFYSEFFNELVKASTSRSPKEVRRAIGLYADTKLEAKRCLV